MVFLRFATLFVMFISIAGATKKIDLLMGDKKMSSAKNVLAVSVFFVAQMVIIGLVDHGILFFVPALDIDTMNPAEHPALFVFGLFIIIV